MALLLVIIWKCAMQLKNPFSFLAKIIWKIFKFGFVLLSQLESNKTLQISVHAILKGNFSGLFFFYLNLPYALSLLD